MYVSPRRLYDLGIGLKYLATAYSHRKHMSGTGTGILAQQKQLINGHTLSTTDVGGVDVGMAHDMRNADERDAG
jgi:hypothetical protein